MRLAFFLTLFTVLLLANTGSGKKDTASTGVLPTQVPDPANNTSPKNEDPDQDAKLLTTEELEAKLKGKSVKDVTALLGEPNRQYGMESGAGRMIYDKKIARNAKLGKHVSGTVWFARDVVDTIAFDRWSC